MGYAGHREAARSVTAWLIEQTLAETSIEDLLQGAGERLNAAGIPVWRLAVIGPTLHPLYFGKNWVWVRADGVRSIERPHQPFAKDDAWQMSTYFQLVEHDRRHLRLLLADLSQPSRFPLLDQLRARGGTDYVAFRVPMPMPMGGEARGPDGLLGSFTTDAVEGWRPDDLEALREIEGILAVAIKATLARDVTRNILSAYLGTDAGERVLNGTIRRGDCTSLRAVIWFSDLRASTTLAERLGPQEYFRTLNAYFESTAGCVVPYGGEILRFIGDAALAIFPTKEHRAGVVQACRNALDAAYEAHQRVEALNVQRSQSGAPVLKHGIALHQGEVLFGNIGLPSRIEFSVIGAAPNTAARIENLTKRLGEPILVSDAVARHLDVPWRSCGRHALHGVPGDVEVFAPPTEAISF